MFARLLTLLNALWENFSVAFENFDFVKMVSLTQDDLSRILERIESKYLNKEEENVVGNSSYLFFVSSEI